MDKREQYTQQVKLLLRLIPFVAEYQCFALKGGTAINLFVRNFPRLSVDIDLVFLPMMERKEALDTIRQTLSELADSIRSGIGGAKVVESFQVKQDALRLTVSTGNAQIKIELSPVLRGTVYPSAVMAVNEGVEEDFGYAEIQVVHFADLFAGKICAALDRQHPRDLFDVKLLLDTEGFDHNLRQALLVYLISQNRPISELLRPRLKDISGLYEGEFRSMAQEEVSLRDLEETRGNLIELINSSLTERDRKFLLTFKHGTPDWSLLNVTDIEHLPAVRWKLQNLSRMSVASHTQAVLELERVLET